MKPGSMGLQQLDKRKDSRPMVLYGPQIDLSIEIVRRCLSGPQRKTTKQGIEWSPIYFTKKLFDCPDTIGMRQASDPTKHVRDCFHTQNVQIPLVAKKPKRKWQL